jgi:hypothetical protein
MIKVEFKKLELEPCTRVEYYNSINRIPISVTIGNCQMLIGSIFGRNIDNQNFIEFSFDKVKKNLYNITILTIQNDTVINKTTDLPNIQSESYVCDIIEENSIIENVLPLIIIRYRNAIQIEINTQNIAKDELYKIGKDCYIGVDVENYLRSIIFTSLTANNLYDIFGIR